jgi:hypothetical protein
VALNTESHLVELYIDTERRATVGAHILGLLAPWHHHVALNTESHLVELYTDTEHRATVAEDKHEVQCLNSETDWQYKPYLLQYQSVLHDYRYYKIIYINLYFYSFID